MEVSPDGLVLSFGVVEVSPGVVLVPPVSGSTKSGGVFDPLTGASFVS